MSSRRSVSSASTAVRRTSCPCLNCLTSTAGTGRAQQEPGSADDIAVRPSDRGRQRVPPSRTIRPSGKDIATTARRALVYRDDVKGTKGQWKLVEQVAFKAADVNMGITEFAAIGEDGFLGAGTLLRTRPMGTA